MKTSLTFTLALVADRRSCLCAARRAWARPWQGQRRARQGQKLKDLNITEADERKIGEQVSDKVRTEFGVFQDKAVTKYVTLVGMVLAQGQHPSRSEVGVHRPRHRRRERVRLARRPRAHHPRRARVDQERGGAGRRARARSRAHHEEAHRQRDPEEQAAWSWRPTMAPGSNALIEGLANAAYDNIVEKGFDRGDEEDADAVGIRLANKVGYNPAGLGTFLDQAGGAEQGSEQRAQRAVRLAPGDEGTHRQAESADQVARS